MGSGGRGIFVAVIALIFAINNVGYAALAFVGVNAPAAEALAAKVTVSVVDYAQCANDPAPSTATNCPGGWINGILNANNSHYAEDAVTAQRAEVMYPAGDAITGATLTFKYETTKGGIHAYDSLATWNYSQTTANKDQGLNPADVVGGLPSLLQMASDPTAATHELPAANRMWTMYGGSLTGTTVPSHDCTTATTPCAGDDYATVTVTYNVPASTTDRKVQLLFGGHIAASTGVRGWGPGLGASFVSGGPYHIKWDLADGASVGNRDNQITSGAIVVPPSLTITKTTSTPTVTAGGTATFNIQVTNSSSATENATGVQVTDALPSGFTYASLTSATGGTRTATINPTAGQTNLTFGTWSLAPGETLSITFNANAPSGANACTSYNNNAAFTSTNAGSGSTSSPATVTVTNCTSPDVTVAKTGNGPLNAGQTATFTITVTAGGVGSSSNVTLTDALPSGTWTLGGADAASCSITSGTLNCSFGTMASGTSKVVTLSRATTGADCPSITNPLVTVNATGDTNTANNTAGPTTITVNCQPDVSIAKTGNGPLTAGQTATFTITVTAGGTGSSTNVTVSDTLPAGTWTLGGANAAQCSITTGTLTCNFGTMASGTSKSVTLSRATTAGDCPSISNTATVTATGDTNTGNNSSSATITVNCQPDVSVVKSGNGPIAAGGTATFSVTVTAGGTGPSSNVTLSDTLPSGTWTLGGADAAACSITSGTLTCNFGTMASGTSKTVTLSRTTSGADCPSIPNTATVSATGDTNAGNNTSSATITVNCAPDVSIIKQGSPAVSAGGVVTFSIVVTAGGTGPSTNVTLTDALPAGTWTLGGADAAQCNIASGTLTCTFGTMAEGAVKSVTLTRVTTAQDCPSITNTATVTATGDANTQNNSATATITVNCGAISITKLADAASVNAGSNIGFTITVTNTGLGTATNVTVTDTLPAGLSWSISPANASCAIATGTLTCNFGSLAPNATASVHLTSPTAAANCGTIRNTATVTTGNDGSAESADSVTVNCQPDVSVLKTGNGPLTSGATATFTIVVSAGGTGGSTNVTLSDTLPAGTWTLGGANAASCTLTGSSLSCSFGNMASGTTKTITLSRPSTNNDCPTPIANTATVNATGDTNLQNNTSSASITVNCPPPPPPPPGTPNVTVTKTADATLVTAGTQGGSTVGFTITLTNSGPISTTASLTDTPLIAAGPNTPAGNAGTAGLTWTIDAANSDAGCNITGSTLSCGWGLLNPGQSKHVHILATVTARSNANSRTDNCGQRVDNQAIATIGDGSNRQSNHATVDIACLPTTSGGTLTISKYSDNNGNAAKDANESALAGWTFQVTNNATGATKLVTTDANGNATVADLEFGTYTVTETSCASPCDKSKWTAISFKIGADAAVKSSTGSAQVTISGPAQSITFGNRPPQLPSTSTEDNNSGRLQAMTLLLTAAMLLQLLALRMRTTVSLRRRRTA